MTKVRKQKRKKKFRYSVNKKRLKRKLIIGPNIQCAEIKKEWDHGKSAQCNIEEMGLAYDVNKTIGKTSAKDTLKSKRIRKKGVKATAPKQHVADNLLEDALAPRESKFRLSKGLVSWLSYLITKYGEDYQAMSRDKKNHYQETWKQIRSKINTFKRIPAQYNEFLKSQENKPMDTT